jgi:dTDP-glucose 4,6-dehydratase
MIARAAGMDFEIEADPARVRPAASEVERLCADASLAAGRLNWRPTVSIEEGLARVVAFIRDNPTLYRPAEYAV